MSICLSAMQTCAPSRKGWWTFAPPILSHSQERRFLLRFPGLSEMFIPQISSLPSPKWKPLNYFINAGGRSSLGWVVSSNSIGIMILVKEVASSTSELKLVHLYVYICANNFWGQKTLPTATTTQIECKFAHLPPCAGPQPPSKWWWCKSPTEYFKGSISWRTRQALGKSQP